MKKKFSAPWPGFLTVLNRESLEEVLSFLPTAFLVPLIIFLFIPSEIYQSNIGEFKVNFIDLLPGLMGLTFCAFVILTVPRLGLGKKASRLYYSFVFAIALLVYIQGVIIVWNYGALDGTGIVWRDYWFYGIIDSALWIGMIFSCWYYFEKMKRFIPLVSSVLCVIVIIDIAATTNFFYSDSFELKKSIFDDPSDVIAKFSRDHNTMVIILDAVQSDNAQHIFERYHRIRRSFEGFLYFYDAAGHFPSTELSVPAILSGRIYDQSMTVSDFAKTDYLDKSLLRVASELGMQVNFLSNKMEFCSEGLPNVRCNHVRQYVSGGVLMRLRTIWHLIDLALFRSLPHFIKPTIFNDQEWLLTRLVADATLHISDKQFLQQLTFRISSDALAPTFKFFHFVLTHSPVRFGPECEYGIFLKNRETHIGQNVCGLRLVGELLDQMKKRGVYDNTQILIIADHGSGFPIRLPMTVSSLAGEITKAEALNDRRVMGTAYPMFMIKPRQAEGPLRFSSVPVQLGDIPVMICKELPDCHFDYGPGLFDFQEGASRTRVYWYYKADEILQNLQYFPAMEEFELSGPVYDAASWRKLSIRDPAKLLLKGAPK